MGKTFFKNNLISLLAALAVTFISCSNTVPQIHNTSCSVIFDYSSYDDFPKARLSIFVETTSNPRRFDSIIVTCDQNEYVWEATDLILAADDKNTYCGTTNLVMPANEQIPFGEYTITFHQSDDEQEEIKRTLVYDKTPYTVKGKDLSQNFYGEKMLKVYNSENEIIYYGPRTAELKDARGIWNNYPNAVEFQESWIGQNGTVICNMPLEKVVPGN